MVCIDFDFDTKFLVWLKLSFLLKNDSKKIEFFSKYFLHILQLLMKITRKCNLLKGKTAFSK